MNKISKNKNLALSQILLLVVGILAFGYAIGSEIELVSGEKLTFTFEGKRYSTSYLRDPKGESNVANWAKTLPSGNWKIFTFNDKDDIEALNTHSFAINEEGDLLRYSTTEQGGNVFRPFSDASNLELFGKDNKLIDFTSAVNVVKNKGEPAAAGNPANQAGDKDGEQKTEDKKSTIDCKEGDNKKLPACASFLGILGKSLLYAAGIYGAIQLVGTVLGLDDERIKALSGAGFLGILVGNTLADYGASKLAIDSTSGWSWVGKEYAGGLTGAEWAGIGVATLYFLNEYRDIDEQIVSFECRPWQASLGGRSCEDCGRGLLPCSQYQCKSLGQGCEIVNPGTIDEKCVWVNRNDVSPPTIEPLEDALLNNYRYIPNDAILPPDRGVKINYDLSNDNCVPAFTPLRFGVTLDEPAACKADLLRKDTFEEMDIFMSNGLLLYNHTFSLSLPGSSNLESEGIEVQNDGIFDLFVRCQDSNGNANIGTFVFNYCIDKGPDTTPPLIVATNIKSGLPIAFNQSSVDLEVYINEPAECKWSRNNRDYDSMEETMVCNNFLGQTNAQGLYTCTTTLTGLKDRFNNQFYFRCKDQPNAVESDRNENVESFLFTLRGTQPLVINSLEPNDTTVKDSTDAVRVTLEVGTSAGSDEGKSTCYYSNTGDDEDFIKFFETDSFKHSQDLFLLEGTYEFFIRCTDLGGNTDNGVLSFEVESDNSSPAIVRAYHEEQYLKLITDEEAECVYDLIDCTYPFEEGLPITAIDKTNHFADWDITSNLYVKCKDQYGNEPLPNECSIIVKSTDF